MPGALSLAVKRKGASKFDRLAGLKRSSD